jgi:acyl-CoA thioester hydrolase
VEHPVRVSVQLLDYDSKRLHCFQKLCHATEDWLSATSEVMSLHVDLEAKKTSPFPHEIASRLAQMKTAHAKLPPPDGAGRKIAMPDKA